MSENIVARPRQMAKLGEFYLQEAVLDVLVANFDGWSAAEEYGLTLAQLSQKTGIWSGPKEVTDSGKTLKTGTLRGILDQLVHQKRVVQYKTRTGKSAWKATREEYKERERELFGQSVR